MKTSTLTVGYIQDSKVFHGRGKKFSALIICMFACLFLSPLIIVINIKGQTGRQGNIQRPGTLPPSTDSQTTEELMKIEQGFRETLKKFNDLQESQEKISQTLNKPFWYSFSFWISVIIGLVAICITVYVANQQIKKGSLELATVRTGLETEIEKIKEVTKGVENNLNQQILSIKEITSQRQVVNGFANIFKTAEEMVNKSTDFFWMLNFTLNFGHIHSFNPILCQELECKTQPEMKGRVTRFKQRIEVLAEDPNVDFRTAFLKTEEFEKDFLDPIVSKQVVANVNAEIKDKVVTEHSESIKDIKRALGRAGKSPADFCVGLENIPLQMFIADTDSTYTEEVETLVDGQTKKETVERKKKACLVFFVGSENVGVNRQERGIYTEVNDLVGLFKDVFESILSWEKRHQNSPGTPQTSGAGDKAPMEAVGIGE
jgi:hypothetical protein